MDLKTLEYMEERATNAREIVTRIEELNRHILAVKGKRHQCTVIKIDSGQINLTGWGQTEVANIYQAEVEAHMLNVYIDVTQWEIQRLEKLLMEL